MFVLAIIAGSIALIVFAIGGAVRVSEGSGGDHYGSNVANILGGILVASGVLFTILSSFFTQDVGQASVLRDWGGNIVGEAVTTPGSHSKAPWVDTITFDVRNQRVVYTGGDSKGDNSGGSADGPQITVQDADGVTSNIDITVTYSIDPSAVVSIYKQYLNEDNLRAKLIFNDIRSLTRTVPGSYSTIELLTNREQIAGAIRDKLETKWADDGLIVDDVALQEIRPPQSVVDSYAAAAQAKINVETEQAKLEATQVSAQQKVVQAQAEADANAILNASLTSAILQQRYLDTLKELATAGNLVVVPEGFNGLVNVGK